MKRKARKPKKRPDNAVARAVAAVGGPTRAARVCNVSNSAIHKWINKGSITELRHAFPLSQASGVPIQEFIGEEEE